MTNHTLAPHAMSTPGAFIRLATTCVVHIVAVAASSFDSFDSAASSTASNNRATIETPAHEYTSYMEVKTYFPMCLGFLLFIAMWHLPNSVLILVTEKVFGFAHVIAMQKLRDEAEDEDENEDEEHDITVQRKEDRDEDCVKGILAASSFRSQNLQEKLLSDDDEKDALGPGDVEMAMNHTVDMCSPPPESDSLMVLKPLGSLVWIMRVQVDLNEDEVRNSTCDRILPGFIVSTAYSCFHALPPMCFGRCARMQSLVGHSAGSGVWIRRYLKVMLWLCTWTCLIFFVDQAIMWQESITLEHSTVTDTDLKCPAEVTHGGQADCFSQNTTPRRDETDVARIRSADDVAHMIST
jgi:hypothetical protein